MSQAYDKLRKYINPYINGKNTRAIIESLASGDQFLLDNSEALNKNIFIKTATGQELDDLMSNEGLARPDLIGLSDDVFRRIGLEVINQENIRKGFHTVFDAFFDVYASRAYATSSLSEPYNIPSGTQLRVEIDYNEYIITFEDNDFTNTSAVSAAELANSISNKLFKLGSNGFALEYFDGVTSEYKVRLLSNTIGSNSSVKVTGLQAQDFIRFDRFIETTQTTGTELTISWEGSAVSRFTWTGGQNPGFDKLKTGDYVNVYADVFDSTNQGTYFINSVVYSTTTNGSCYFEINNVNISTGASDVVVLTDSTEISFFRPIRSRVDSKNSYATLFEINNEINAYIPTFTTALERTPTTGGAYFAEDFTILNHSSCTFTPGETVIGQTSLAFGYVVQTANTSTTLSLLDGTFVDGETLYGEESNVTATLTSTSSYFDNPMLGSYLFDFDAYQFFGQSVTSNQSLTVNSSVNLLNVSSTTGLPSSGYLVIDFGYDNQEDLIPYTRIVNSSQLAIDPSYKIKKRHEIGAEINYQKNKNKLNIDLFEYSFGSYMTDIAKARDFAVNTMSKIKTGGTLLNLTVLYPGDFGLGNYGTEYSDIKWVYGDEP